MRSIRHQRILRACSALFSVIALAAPAAAFGPEWEEDNVGDAGKLPISAQPVVMPGGGPLGGITGRLEGTGPAAGEGDFQDMYLINIVDPAAFSATTVKNDSFNGFTEFDSQLFLLRIEGLGLLANDNFSVDDNASFLGPAADDGSGAQITEPGLYFIAISGFNSDAVSKNGPIFDMPAGSTEVSGPDGTGGELPIVDWNQPGQIGDYRIEFTGVAFIDVFACPTDLNDSGFTDVGDLLMLLGNWETDGPGAELAEPLNVVDVADLLALLSQWGPCPDQTDCGEPDAGDCCQANGTPFCASEACCIAVCFADPFCCEVAWDANCAEQANRTCAECQSLSCGDPGTGFCCSANATPYCDDADCCTNICKNDPFCCDVEWDQICADAAVGNPNCNCSDDGGCPTDCPSRADQENEPCGDDLNGGCNADPVSFGSLACGQSVCGTAWADGGLRDTDWFELSIKQSTQVTATLESEFPGVVFIVDISDCESPTVLANGAGDQCASLKAASTCLTSGSYSLFVAAGTPDGSGIFKGFPCDSGENDYILSLQCVPADCP